MSEDHPPGEPEGGTPQPDESQGAVYPLDADTDTDAAASALPASADAGGTRLLARFLKLTPFLDLHDRAGGNHRLRLWVCFIADFLVRACAIALIFAIVVCVVWKTLAPLPQFWHH